MQNSGSMQLIVDIIMCIYSILLVHYIYLFYHKKFIIDRLIKLLLLFYTLIK